MSHDAEEKPKLHVADKSAAGDVPTFACIVYVSKDDDGVRARVANLADLQCSGPSERDVLGQIVPKFKQRIRELMTTGEPIPWVDPPAQQQPGEQKRFVPVHL